MKKECCIAGAASAYVGTFGQNKTINIPSKNRSGMQSLVLPDNKSIQHYELYKEAVLGGLPPLRGRFLMDGWLVGQTFGGAGAQCGKSPPHTHTQRGDIIPFIKNSFLLLL